MFVFTQVRSPATVSVSPRTDDVPHLLSLQKPSGVISGVPETWEVVVTYTPDPRNDLCAYSIDMRSNLEEADMPISTTLDSTYDPTSTSNNHTLGTFVKYALINFPLQKKALMQELYSRYTCPPSMGFQPANTNEDPLPEASFTCGSDGSWARDPPAAQQGSLELPACVCECWRHCVPQEQRKI